MEKTPFYGYENAGIKDPEGITLGEYYEMLRDCWCAETCAPRMRDRWTKENLTLGQCSITSFLMQDRFGGKVLGIPLKSGDLHCYNVVEANGREYMFDLTSGQLGEEVPFYEKGTLQTREAHLKKTEKKERYEVLRSKLYALLENRYNK